MAFFAAACLALSAAVSAFAAEPATSPTGTTPPEEASAIEDRLRSERATRENSFVLTPHRPNYILPVTYNASVNRAPYGAEGDQLQSVEVKFQISFKADIASGLFGKNGDLYIAYTQLSMWQAYNSDYSSPFRETNYEPEAFLSFDTDVRALGLRNRLLLLGIAHQSNGQTEPLSRSWNRVYAEFVLDRGRFALAIKPWYRFRESAAEDDNPDIGRYMGPGEIRMFYEWKKYVLGLTVRNNFRIDDQKGAEQLEFSFPLTRRIKGYFQYFYGYGETLIDYIARTNRVGIGILLTDWL
ncbi:MAG: phospholipase A [Nitrospirae bacterium]|nr:phospholipase A [Nitrospirota bacterium]